MTLWLCKAEIFMLGLIFSNFHAIIDSCILGGAQEQHRDVSIERQVAIPGTLKI